MSELIYVHKPSREQTRGWAAPIRLKYPGHYTMEDRAAGMLIGYLESTASPTTIFCLEDGQPVGFVFYQWPEAGDRPSLIERIEIINLAVLPSHQRRGIGTAILERLKDLACGKVPIFASGLLPPAIPCLLSAGFRPAKRRDGEPAYKWSDLPNHQNDQTPGADDDDDIW